MGAPPGGDDLVLGRRRHLVSSSKAARRHGPPIANQAPHRHRQANSGTCRGREPPHARHTCLRQPTADQGCVLRHSVDLGIAIDFGGLLNARSAGDACASRSFPWRLIERPATPLRRIVARFPPGKVAGARWRCGARRQRWAITARPIPGGRAAGGGLGCLAPARPSNPLPPAVPQPGYRDITARNDMTFPITGRARCASTQNRARHDVRSRTRVVGRHAPHRTCRRCRGSRARPV